MGRINTLVVQAWVWKCRGSSETCSPRGGVARQWVISAGVQVQECRHRLGSSLCRTARGGWLFGEDEQHGRSRGRYLYVMSWAVCHVRRRAARLSTKPSRMLNFRARRASGAHLFKRPTSATESAARKTVNSAVCPSVATRYTLSTFLCELSSYLFQTWFPSFIFSGPSKKYSMKCYERGSQTLGR